MKSRTKIDTPREEVKRMSDRELLDAKKTHETLWPSEMKTAIDAEIERRKSARRTVLVSVGEFVTGLADLLSW